MEVDDVLIPPVVGVVVVHNAGDWLAETLDALASQDYLNLRWLWLINGNDDLEAIREMVLARIPTAIVRAAVSGEGFAAAADEVLELVEGDNGYFWFCHDDVAPQPGALHRLVAEMVASNAGVVGPKLMDFDDPQRVQSVGFEVDRCGELISVVEAGERDQGQHDGRRDVFMVPSACMLVRADLFRTLGGFDPQLWLYGEDLDLCWRAHQCGARVVVVPEAQVRHRSQLAMRRPDLDHELLRERHRVRVVATNTSGPMWALRIVEMTAIAVMSLVAGVVTGRLMSGAAGLRAVVALGPRAGTIWARRRQIAAVRVVPEAAVSARQSPGSARWRRWWQRRQEVTYLGMDATVRRWRSASYAPVVTWVAVLIGVLLATRGFMTSGVPAVGEFLAFPESPRDLASLYMSGWDPRNGGVGAAAPTGWMSLALLSVLAGFRMELAMTMAVIGLVMVGAAGMWRLASVFPTVRAQVAAMVVYVATPLVPGLWATGAFSGLVMYAMAPWAVHLARRVAGIGTADPALAGVDLPDAVARVPGRERLRLLAIMAVWLGVAAAFVPAVVVVWPLMGATLVLGSVVARSSVAVVGWLSVAATAPVVAAVVVNLPWAWGWSWVDITGVTPIAGERGIIAVVSLAVDGGGLGALGLGMYVAVGAGLLVCRAWRLTWAVRAALLVVVFAGLGLLADRGDLPVAVPGVHLLSVPVAVGLALAAAAVVGGFGDDVSRRGFGWRQPVAVVAHLGLLVGVIPALVAIGPGDLGIASTTPADLLRTLVARDAGAGEARVLVVGDPRAMPVGGFEVVPGVAAAVVDAGSFSFLESAVPPRTATERLVREAMARVAADETRQVGRILAAAGVRYVVVPTASEHGGVAVAPPEGLIGALQRQLDLGETFGAPSLKVFVNQAWIPAPALLVGAAAEASQQSALSALVATDLSGAGVVPVLGPVDPRRIAVGEVGPGVVHLGVGVDERWVLRVDGREVAPRRGLGGLAAFDVDISDVATGGTARIELEYRPGLWPQVALMAQALGWVLLLGAATRVPMRRTRRRGEITEAVWDLDELSEVRS